jgi:CheY-like chemotaxis protein
MGVSSGQTDQEYQNTEMAQAVPQRMASDQEPANAESGSAPNTGDTPRDVILVIDDDAQVRELMTRFLTKEGWQVTTAATAVEGLSLAQEMKPAAITLDANLTGTDGWSVLTAIKANPALTHIPIILITLSDDTEHGYTLGVTDFLTKPIDWGRISAMLGKYRGSKTNCRVLIIDDDAANREVLSRMVAREGWAVSEAANVRAALKRLMNAPPDLILLDLMMPEMDCFEVVRLLRESQTGRSIPVVVVTAKDLTADDRRELSGSVERIIQKGAFRKEELLEELRSLVSATVPGGRPFRPATPAALPSEQPTTQSAELQRELERPATPAVSTTEQPASQLSELQWELECVRSERDAALSQAKESLQWEEQKAKLLEEQKSLLAEAEEARRLVREQQHSIELLQAECNDAAGIAEDIENLREEVARLKAEVIASQSQTNTSQEGVASQLAEATATHRQLTRDLDDLRQENEELKEELTRVRQEQEKAAPRVKKKKKKKLRLASVVADTPLPESADADVWHIVYQDENGQSHKMTCSTAGVRMWVEKGLLRDLTQTLASRSNGGPFNPLSSFPEFRDLMATDDVSRALAQALQTPAGKSTQASPATQATIPSDNEGEENSNSLILLIIVLVVGGLVAFFGSQYLMNN